ncbi:hypothetical protein DPMN_011379 [Dreissena polymorpha]|uniref:Uncharacterized protein n=1 Tax=Dreissena polymorpha TaxID=45954 RepID=A0A9D4N3U5_DREPO|nr:hypothetical protein DPMN_011379 [Dreissena polymorpha]
MTFSALILCVLVVIQLELHVGGVSSRMSPGDDDLFWEPQLPDLSNNIDAYSRIRKALGPALDNLDVIFQALDKNRHLKDRHFLSAIGRKR